jgi:uracil-DNA glycosylase family 4
VRCVPPQNKPTPEEIATCRRYLTPAISALSPLRIMLALGRIAHESTVRALKLSPAKFPFAHGARHPITPAISLFDSYHCSRYNTNTGVLTEAMFRQVFASIRAELDRSDHPAPVA